MNNEHVISDEVLELCNDALVRGENWMAYNGSLYFIEKDDIQFFKSQTDAQEFAFYNHSDRDHYAVIHFESLWDVFNKIPYGTTTSGLSNNPDANGLYNYEGNKFTDALIENMEQQSIKFNSQIKISIMNNENLKYLTDNIKYMGFGENLKDALEKNMFEGKPEFQLKYNAEINKKPFEATLNFKKSDQTDMYFFNSYNASLQKNNGEKMEQTFYINKGKGITSKEAFNLLDGRAVHKDLVTKENQPYKAWLQLDLGNKDNKNNFEVKQYHENYGFDLKTAVGKFAIAELKDPEKEKALMQSLQKGNVQSVTIEKDGSSHKMFIEADPQFKKVNLYDSNMKMVAKESVEKYQSVGKTEAGKAVKEDMGNDKKKELSKEVKPGKELLGKQKDNTLLPKKRESHKKGLGVS
ncbi:hypothetical protein [Ferruginibacter profundus]